MHTGKLILGMDEYLIDTSINRNTVVTKTKQCRGMSVV